jgi:hypothetical protein
MVLAAARQLEAMGIDFILIAGKESEATVLANICPGCAADYLSSALAGAILARNRGEEDMGMGPWLQ